MNLKTMKGPIFSLGWDDYKIGNDSWNKIPNMIRCILYEHGRQTAALCGDVHLLSDHIVGGTLTKVCQRYNDAIRNNWIC